MAVNTHKDVTLSFTLGGTEVACQLQEPDIIRPWAGSGNTTTMACGDILAEDSETPESGSISGNVAADYSDAGVTKLLDEQLGNVVGFTWIETVDGTPNRTRTLAGNAKVLPITRTWRHGRYAFHDLNLEFVEETAAPVYADVV